MGKDKHKCCCKDKSYKKYCNPEKKCHHEEGHEHCNDQYHEESCVRRRCCKCGCYCKMIYFKKFNGCCKFIYKCECGHCFEYICDCKHDCCYERECCCLDKENTIKIKICCVEKTCKKKKTCNHNCSKMNKCCKCR